jgi:hypothetical protein
MARKAAEASLCAAEQGDFWALHDTLFADQLHLQSILEHVTAIGANPAIFANCMESGKYAAKVAADPSRIKAVRSIVGNAPYGEFQKAIAEALKVSVRHRSGIVIPISAAGLRVGIIRSHPRLIMDSGDEHSSEVKPL